MAQSIPVGSWPDFDTAAAFGGNVLRTAADRAGAIVTEWAAVPRDDGLWMVEGCWHFPEQNYASEGDYVSIGGR